MLRVFALLGTIALATPAVAPQAKADVYNFSIGAGTAGTFTTGAASSFDMGYFSLTDIRFTAVTGTDSVTNLPVFFANQIDKQLEFGAAYNPTSMTFINHSGGNNTYYDSGSIYTQDINLFSGLGVNRQYGGYSVSTGNQFLIAGALDISPGVGGVPEPSTWAMMLLGFGGLGFLSYRRFRNGDAAPMMVA